MSSSSECLPPPSGRQLDTMEKGDTMEKAKTLAERFGSKRSLRIAIVTENFLPKVDGVTRTLARLLEHLEREGHEALVLGPESGMTSYAGAEVIGTRGIPLLGIYSGLSLNFIRPRFIRRLLEFKPDVIQFVDPIWLCAQCIPAVQYYLPDTPLLTSYHTNLAMYATLFGFSWLTPTMWNIQKNLHGRCSLTYCPSPSTARMLEKQGFENVRLWPRGVDARFNPKARDYNLRRSWTAEVPLDSQTLIESSSSSDTSRRSSLELNTPPPPYSLENSIETSDKIVLLYVGRISWEKNLRLLVEAARGLQISSEAGSRPACQLVFVGEGPSRPELEAICAQYDLDARFLGFKGGDELAACYASADIFTFPSWTETFGQVVLESLASGLPVVGLRAEGVCDLVKDGETGLLLDLDDLLAPGSPEKLQSDLHKCDPTTFRPLPENPHSLVDVSSPTFSLAVSLYRNLIVELATNHSRRKSMGKAAALAASSKNWHGAMELLVDGYREISKPISSTRDSNTSASSTSLSSLTLSRTSTIEETIDIVSHLASEDKVTYAESTAASPRTKRLGVGRVLKLGGVFRRTGGKLKESSISLPTNLFWRRNGTVSEPRTLSWLGKGATIDQSKMGSAGENLEGVLGEIRAQSIQIWYTRWAIKLALMSYVIYTLIVLLIQNDIISSPYSYLSLSV